LAFSFYLLFLFICFFLNWHLYSKGIFFHHKLEHSLHAKDELRVEINGKNVERKRKAVTYVDIDRD